MHILFNVFLLLPLLLLQLVAIIQFVVSLSLSLLSFSNLLVWLLIFTTFK